MPEVRPEALTIPFPRVSFPEKALPFPLSVTVVDDFPLAVAVLVLVVLVVFVLVVVVAAGCLPLMS